MRKLIASGEILKDTSVVIVGAVYATIKADGTEDTTAGSHYVNLYVKQLGAASMPAEAITFTDIEDLATLKVPGYDGHADVTVDTPVSVVYAKSKAFPVDGNKAQINTVYRYNY